MCKLFTTLIILLLSAFNICSQNTFKKVYGGQLWVNPLHRTDDNGFVASYSGPVTESYSDEMLAKLDAGVVKLDSNYEVEWARSFSSKGVDGDQFGDVVEYRGSYYARGYDRLNNGFRRLLTKIDQNGNVIWTKYFVGVDRVGNIQVLNDQLWITVASSKGVGGSGFLILNEDGEILEHKMFGANYDIIFRGVTEYDDEYYLTGISLSDEDSNIILGKLSKTKELLWLNEYVNPNTDNFTYGGHTEVSISNDQLFIIYRDVNPEIASDSNTTIAILKTSLDGRIISGSELKLPYANLRMNDFSPQIINDDYLFLGVQTKTKGIHSPGVLITDLDLRNIQLKRYAVNGLSLSNLNSVNLLDDGLLIGGFENLYINDYTGFYLMKTTFQGNTACGQLESSVVRNDITNDYSVNKLNYSSFVQVSLEDGNWDTTYVPEVGIVYNCEENHLTLFEKDRNGHCKGDEVTLSIYGKEGELIWNIDTEDIVEETDQAIRFIIREDKVVEVRDNSNERIGQLEIKLSCDELVDMRVSQTLSPNEDGYNDVWKIEYLDQYPDHKILILDQWGEEVFMKENYKNDWDGDDLPKGIYYYLILRNYKDDNPLYGRLVINY